MKFFWSLLDGFFGKADDTPLMPVTPPALRRLRQPPPILAVLHGPILAYPTPAADFKRGRTVPVDLIVLHDTEGSAPGALRWLTEATPPEVSAHYVIAKDGQAWRLVAEQDTAYHAGGGMWRGRQGVNSRSVGIELERLKQDAGAYPSAQLETCVWLCVDLCRRYRLDPHTQIEAHAVLDPTRRKDPREFPWAAFRGAVAHYLEDPRRPA